MILKMHQITRNKKLFDQNFDLTTCLQTQKNC